jgi:hypothetical protein
MAKQTNHDMATSTIGSLLGITPPVSPASPSASSPITITRHSKVYRNGRTGICMSIPQDVAELLGIKPGETMLVTAFKDGKGWCRLDKADNL